MVDAPSPVFTPRPGADSGYAVFPKDRVATADDGTPLAWTLLPAAPGVPERLPVVTTSGWSCSDAYWAQIAPLLTTAGHPVLVYDARGHGASGLPRDPGRNGRNLRAEDISMVRLATDVTHVMQAASIDTGVLMGHSMGVQVALEVHRMFPDRISGLALAAGSYENPLRTFFGLPVADAAFPFAHLAVNAIPAPITRLALQPARITPVAARAARLLRATGPKARPEDLGPYLHHLAAADMGVMMRLISSMRNHSAADHLRSIDVPTLILAAGRDTFTPPRCSQHMFERVPTAEIQWFPDAGHTLPIEEPDAIVEHVDDWYRRRIGPKSTGATQPPGKKRRGTRATSGRG